MMLGGCEVFYLYYCPKSFCIIFDKLNAHTTMSNKTRSILKGIAVVLVLLAVVMHLGWILIPAIAGYKFWFVVIGFGLLLISSK